jgi:hypothetical protein
MTLTRPKAANLRTGSTRQLIATRLDPVLYAQVRAALAPVGVPLTVLIERLLLDFVRTCRTPADVARALSGLPDTNEGRK